MQAQVKAWENSQGIRLSKELLEKAGIQLKEFKHKTLEERAAEFGGKLGPYEETTWGDPMGREG